MSLNILLTVHQFFPEFFAGTEILTLNVAKELIGRGHRVCIFTGYPTKKQLADDERFDKYKFDGIDVFRFHHSYDPMGGQTALAEIQYNNRLATSYFAQLLQRLKPDIVHFFHLSRLGITLIDAAVEAAVPAYYTPTDFWSICPTSQLLLPDGRMCTGPTRNAGNCVKHLASVTRRSRANRPAKFVPTFVAEVIAKLTVGGMLPDYPNCHEVAAVGRRKSFNVARLNALHGIVSPTRLVSEMLSANGVDDRLIVQSMVGIDLDAFRNSAARVYRGGPVKFGFIGTLAHHKGCHILIDAFRQIGSDAAQLLIYGPAADRNYLDDLRQRAAQADSIKFCGTYEHSQVAKVLAGIDVLVVPSLWYENAPQVVLFALAAKCPLLVSDLPGMTEVVRDGWNGLVFPPGDVPSLRARMTRLIDEPSLLSALSANCSPLKSTSEYVDALLSLYVAHDMQITKPDKIRPARVRQTATTPDFTRYDRQVFAAGTSRTGD